MKCKKFKHKCGWHTVIKYYVDGSVVWEQFNVEDKYPSRYVFLDKENVEEMIDFLNEWRNCEK
jgi:hypothetical protein